MLAKETDDRLWWTWRFLELVVRDFGLGNPVTDDEAMFAVECFAQLAATDADLALSKLSDNGPEGHGFSKFLGGDRLDAALARVRLPTTAGDAMVRARMIIASATWTRADADAEALWTRAWTELQRVPADARDNAWKDAALPAAARADYAAYRTLAEEKLERTTQVFWRAVALAAAIPVAARHKDWPSFERWLAEYRALPPAFHRVHDSCAFLNLEGLRALEEGRVTDAERMMQQVVEIAPSVEYLSNDEVSALAKKLRALGHALALCDAFDAITKEKDWRLQT
jgi:hypothetical protein